MFLLNASAYEALHFGTFFSKNTLTISSCFSFHFTYHIRMFKEHKRTKINGHLSNFLLMYGKEITQICSDNCWSHSMTSSASVNMHYPLSEYLKISSSTILEVWTVGVSKLWWLQWKAKTLAVSIENESCYLFCIFKVMIWPCLYAFRGLVI